MFFLILIRESVLFSFLTWISYFYHQNLPSPLPFIYIQFQLWINSVVALLCTYYKLFWIRKCLNIHGHGNWKLFPICNYFLVGSKKEILKFIWLTTFIKSLVLPPSQKSTFFKQSVHLSQWYPGLFPFPVIMYCSARVHRVPSMKNGYATVMTYILWNLLLYNLLNTFRPPYHLWNLLR